jgi:hypothetical protein
MFLKYLVLMPALVGCTMCIQDVDPVKKFIDQMDKAPPEQRVPNWEQTKTLMARVAPKIGGEAPDFSLLTLDGKQTVKLSQHKDDRPVVLVFGSFT